MNFKENAGFRGWKWMVTIAMLVGVLWSILIPPMKSPDEPDHIRRAYLLSQGQWMLYSDSCAEDGFRCRNGKTASGGMIDKGLIEYLRVKETHNSSLRTVNQVDAAHAKGIRWQYQDEFDTTPGTGFYFPLVYAPQAVGLAVGKAMGLKVERSYYLARFMSLTATVLVLGLAFLIHSPPPVLIGLLLLPMSLFQAVSGSLDPFSTALAVLGLSVFLRMADLRERSSTGLMVLMAVSIFVVVTTRAHLLPMLLMLFMAAWYARTGAAWAIALLTTAAVVAWMVVAIPATVDLRLERSHTTGQIAAWYLQNPLDLVMVYRNTFSDAGLVAGYVKSFIGMFFNLALPVWAHVILASLLLGVLAMSLASWRQWCETALVRVSLIFVGASASFLAFLAMLFTWTQHPANTIQGVQGRYFLVPVMLIFIGFSAWQIGEKWRFRASRVFLFVLFTVGFAAGTRTMLHGYYVPWMTLTEESARGEQKVSAVLAPANPLPLRFETLVEDVSRAPVKRIGVRLATYTRQLSGIARLSYVTHEGRTEAREIPLAPVRDNQFVYVDLPPGHYVRGELSVLSGEGGASVWEYHRREPGASAAWQSCVVLERDDGSRQVPEGCDSP